MREKLRSQRETVMSLSKSFSQQLSHIIKRFFLLNLRYKRSQIIVFHNKIYVHHFDYRTCSLLTAVPGYYHSVLMVNKSMLRLSWLLTSTSCTCRTLDGFCCVSDKQYYVVMGVNISATIQLFPLLPHELGWRFQGSCWLIKVRRWQYVR